MALLVNNEYGSGEPPMQRIGKAIKCLLYKVVILMLPVVAGLSFGERVFDPLLIAHRGGKGNAPENTLFAIGEARRQGADIIWISVQLSKDAVPVLYQPSDLSKLTRATGKVSSKSAAELSKLMILPGKAGFSSPFAFPVDLITIPLLEQVLSAFPFTPFFIDIKSPDADPALMARAVRRVVDRAGSAHRVRFYSTEASFIEALKAQDLKVFATRDETRALLVNYLLTGECHPVEPGAWHGYELHRQVEVIEQFTLGKGVTPAVATWTTGAVNCIKKDPDARLFLFGVNSEQDLQTAMKLGVDGVMTDFVGKMLALPGTLRTNKVSNRMESVLPGPLGLRPVVKL